MTVARKTMLIHVAVDLGLMALAVQIYKFTSWRGAQLLGLPYAPAELIVGMCCVMFLYGFFAPVKTVLAGIMKSVTIYALTHDCDSISEAIRGVLNNFKSTLAIPTFLLLVKSVTEKLADSEIASALGLVNNKEEEKEPSNVVEQFLSLAKDNKLLKMLGSFTTMMIDWVDECILGYCYMQERESIGKAAVTAISIYVKNFDKLSKKAFTVVAIKVCTIALFRVIAIIVALKTVRSISSAMIFYIAVWALEFTINDAVIDNLMMNSLVTEFSRYATDETTVAAEREAVIKELDESSGVEDSNADNTGGLDDILSLLKANIKEIDKLLEV